MLVYLSLRVKHPCFMSCVTDVTNLYFTIEWNCLEYSVEYLILSGYICAQIILAYLDETDRVRGEEVL